MSLIPLCEALARARAAETPDPASIARLEGEVSAAVAQAPVSAMCTAALIRANHRHALDLYLQRHARVKNSERLHPETHDPASRIIFRHFLDSPEVETLAAYARGSALPFYHWSSALIALIGRTDCPRRLALLFAARKRITLFEEYIRDVFPDLGPRTGAFLAEVFHDGRYDIEDLIGTLPISAITLKEFAMLLVQECDLRDWYLDSDFDDLPARTPLLRLMDKPASSHGRLALRAQESNAAALFCRRPDQVFYGLQSDGTGLLRDATLA